MRALYAFLFTMVVSLFLAAGHSAQAAGTPCNFTYMAAQDVFDSCPSEGRISIAVVLKCTNCTPKQEFPFFVTSKTGAETRNKEGTLPWDDPILLENVGLAQYEFELDDERIPILEGGRYQSFVSLSTAGTVYVVSATFRVTAAGGVEFLDSGGNAIDPSSLREPPRDLGARTQEHREASFARLQAENTPARRLGFSSEPQEGRIHIGFTPECRGCEQKTFYMILENRATGEEIAETLFVGRRANFENVSPGSWTLTLFIHRQGGIVWGWDGDIAAGKGYVIEIHESDMAEKVALAAQRRSAATTASAASAVAAADEEVVVGEVEPRLDEEFEDEEESVVAVSAASSRSSTPAVATAPASSPAASALPAATVAGSPVQPAIAVAARASAEAFEASTASVADAAPPATEAAASSTVVADAEEEGGVGDEPPTGTTRVRRPWRFPRGSLGFAWLEGSGLSLGAAPTVRIVGGPTRITQFELGILVGIGEHVYMLAGPQMSSPIPLMRGGRVMGRVTLGVFGGLDTFDLECSVQDDVSPVVASCGETGGSSSFAASVAAPVVYPMLRDGVVLRLGKSQTQVGIDFGVYLPISFGWEGQDELSVTTTEGEQVLPFTAEAPATPWRTMLRLWVKP